METRIKEVNNKFYPERLYTGFMSNYWISEWPSDFIDGNWCGSVKIYALDSLEEAQEFLRNREVKYHAFSCGRI
jgi:hypothetical protein